MPQPAQGSASPGIPGDQLPSPAWGFNLQEAVTPELAWGSAL